MKNEAESEVEKKDPEELEESELERVAGGTGDAFDGQYVVNGVTHRHKATRVSKIDSFTIKQGTVEDSSED